MATLPKRHEMQNRFDLAGYSSANRLILLAEIKSAKEPSEESAAQFRRNLFTHRLLAAGPYFLLAYRNCFYLWKGDSLPDSKPDFAAPAKPVLKKYLGEYADTDRAPGSESMEFAVKLWLSEMASGLQSPDTGSEPDKMLMNSGLFDLLRGGEIRRDLMR